MRTKIGRQTPTDQGIDSAALAAAALAGALSVFSAPGPYVPLNAIVGITLLIIVLAYESGHYRTNFQNIAFGAVCALCSLLVIGFVAEFRQANWNWDYWVDLEKDQRSNVNYWLMLKWWFGLAAVFTVFGFFLRSNSKSEASVTSDSSTTDT